MKDNKSISYERLLHLHKAIVEIQSFTDNVTFDEFLNDTLISSAVLFQFNIIGEAIIHVEASLLEKYEYPWFKVRAFRNLISHEYFNIKLDAVWEIVQNDLSDLKGLIETILIKEF